MEIINSLAGKAPCYFYRIRNNEETIETIANKFNVDPHIILTENQGVEPKEGTIIVINLRG